MNARHYDNRPKYVGRICVAIAALMFWLGFCTLSIGCGYAELRPFDSSRARLYQLEACTASRLKSAAFCRTIYVRGR